MISQLYIENYNTDLTADLSALLTFAIDDVKDFSSRSTTWSKTIVLPGTAANNKLFGHIFQVGQSNEYDSTLSNINYNFNASKSARCIIFQDNIQTFKGVVRLLEIIIDNGRIEYEVAMWGELFGLNVALSSKLLENLDFSAYDEAWNETNIEASWDNPGGSGVYYPLIDYGTYSVAKHDWDFRTFRPALYVKEYIDKMFTAAGYTYDCALFSTARFKSLIIPHNQKKLQQLVTTLFSGARSSGADIINSGTSQVVEAQMTSVVVSSSFTSTISDSRFTYVPVPPLTLTVNYSFSGSYKANATGYRIELKKNGVVVPGTTKNIAQTGDTSTYFYSHSGSVVIAFTQNDYIEVVYTATAFVAGTDFINGSNGSITIVSDIPILSDVNYNGGIEINNTIPRNVRQIDFLVSIVKLFNLYVYEDKFDNKKILIKPYIDFYSTDSSDSVDWTYKLNRSKPLRIKPMSEINAKIYEFKYKPDSDYYNDLYKKRYSQGYGDYTFDSAFEFAQQTNSFELIFSSTPLVGYVGEEKVYPTIFKLSGTTEEVIDSNIRIMQTKKVTGVASWDIKDDVAVLDSYTKYGYAGHFDDPDAPSNDLNFGALHELFFILATGNLSATQFGIYWSGYMAEITDKDSKLMTASFYLKPMDIFNLDFSQFIYVDGNIFRLNSIKDYNASKPDECNVELLRVINLLY